MYPVFFIHSLVDRHQQWLHNETIINSATVNMGVQVSLEHVGLVPFRHISRNAAIDVHTVVLLFIFEDTPH